MIWAIIFFILTLPLCLVAAWGDLKNLRIQNGIPIMLLLVFVVSGPLVLPFDEYLWRLAYCAIAFVLGLLVYMSGIIGGGDVKLFVAMVPFVSTTGFLGFILILTVMSIGGVLAHRFIGVTGMAPAGWKSWEGEQGFWRAKFPFGFILSGTLIFYLALNIILVSG